MEMTTSNLDRIRDGMREVADLTSSLNNAIAKGEEQAITRDGVIQTINEMCDALALASSMISSEISRSIIEYGRVKYENEGAIRSYFERWSIKFSDPSLRLLLHEGAVCGELHKLGDRFETPFSGESMSGMSMWENVKVFFSRSSSMSLALHDLIQGEQDYIRDISSLLSRVRDEAEATTQLPMGNEGALREKGDYIILLMREGRSTLETKLSEIRQIGDLAINKLH